MISPVVFTTAVGVFKPQLILIIFLYHVAQQQLYTYMVAENGFEPSTLEV